MRARRGVLWCSAAALGAAASDATLWTVSTRGFETTCKGPELDAALARAASTKATLTATAPAHITTGDNWYAASGAAEHTRRRGPTRRPPGPRARLPSSCSQRARRPPPRQPPAAVPEPPTDTPRLLPSKEMRKVWQKITAWEKFDRGWENETLEKLCVDWKMETKE